MKKAKISLAILLVSTVAGSSLAFKLKKNGNLFCTTEYGAVCNMAYKFRESPIGPIILYCTTVQGDSGTTQVRVEEDPR